MATFLPASTVEPLPPPAMRSGLFSTESFAKETPCGFERITEGSAVVLFPPAAVKHAATQKKEEAVETNTENDNMYIYGGDNDDDGQAVFYNPAQVVNRDLSVCVLACFSRLRRDESRRRGGTRDGITILEALSATGLRAIRYYKEIPGVRYIIANDLDPDAVECIRRNCEFNGVPCVRPTLEENFPSDHISVDEETGTILSGGGVIPNLDDANDLMFRLATNPTVYAGRRLCVASQATLSNKAGKSNCSIEGGSDGNNATSFEPLLQQELVDVVDLDPYGSASPFLDAAMRCVKEGGLMLVTSTDSAILCGNYPDTCHVKYNSIPAKNAACHEMAVRILLAAVERVANKHRKYIVPLLSLHIDFYVRCFFRVYTQPAEAKLGLCKLGYLLQCSQCPAYWVRPMGLTRMRANKRARKHDASRKGGVTGNHDNNNNNDNNTTEHGTKCKADVLGRECFPTPPLRQDNPKITSCSLQSILPSVNPRCCTVCGAFMTISGPIYAAATQNVSFLTQLLQEIEERGSAKQIASEARVAGLVRLAMEELPDTPLFYQLPDVASFARVRCPPTPLFVGAIGRMGYRCSQVHCSPSGIKTDCPPGVLVGVMLQWKEEQQPSEKVEVENGAVVGTTAVSEAGDNNDNSNSNHGHRSNTASVTGTENSKKHVTVGVRVPLVTAISEADFSYDKKFDFRSSVTGVTKFIPNAPNWGPKRRHQGTMRDDDDEV